ncbi:MAG: DUF455 family protein, partial [Pseudomonadota bacterium]
MSPYSSLREGAVAVLQTSDALAKTRLSREVAAWWQSARAAGTPQRLGTAPLPLRPARPEQPELLDPRDVPRRRPGSPAGRLAILHAIA